MSHSPAREGKRVLVAAPFGRDAASVSELLAGEGYDAQPCLSLRDLAGRLDESTGAILLTEEALADDTGLLQAALAGQPTWSDVPIVFLAARQTGPRGAFEAARRRLPDAVTNVITLERPLGSMSLVSAVASAMRSRQRQFEIRDQMAAIADSARQLARSRDQLAQESGALEILNRTGTRIAAELDPERLVQTVVDAGVELTAAQFGAFFYDGPDPRGGTHLLHALSGIEADALDMSRVSALFRQSFRENGVVRAADSRSTSGPGDCGGREIRSYLTVPVRSRSGEVLGGLMFGHAEPGVFSERSERLMSGLAGQAAIGLDNARLFQAAQRLNQTLEERVDERTAALGAEMQARSLAEAALRQSQKMEAVGQLTGGIAHDFNNMLTGVIGALDILRRRIASGRVHDLDRFMDAASQSAQRAAGLTQRLLAFSRRQSLDSRATDVNALVASLEDLIRRTMSERIAVRVSLGTDVPAALVDANQLESAILNLAINARDAMPEGGELTVETSTVELDAAYARLRGDVRPGRYVVVAVSDTGVGIPAELMDKVFEPFFTTKPIGQGTGLGLSMVYGFAQQSNGQVRIHSRAGDGTSVKIHLPVAGHDERPAEAAAPQTPQGEGQRVLVVEDDETVRLLVRDVLEELGYVAVEAAEPDTAIPILASSQRLDLLVSDVGLPGMNGRQLAEIARRHRPDLPILFITGYAENAAIRAGFLGTNMSMITKPFALETLAAKIGEMLAAARPPG